MDKNLKQPGIITLVKNVLSHFYNIGQLLVIWKEVEFVKLLYDIPTDSIS